MIVCSENISFGQPRLQSRRLTVWDVVSGIFYDKEEYIKNHELTIEQIKDCINYCSNLNCQKDPTLINFCSGCILSTINRGTRQKSNPDDIKIIEDSYVIEGDSIYLGSKFERDDDEFGYPGWAVAERLKTMFLD